MLKNSDHEQSSLRAAARWAADWSSHALRIVETRRPENISARIAVQAGLDFGEGKARDHQLRTIALAAFRDAKGVDEASKHALRAASLIAAIAYTHTDLHDGLQGIRQARHILGPVVHTALALEVAGGDATIGETFIVRAAESAPESVVRLLRHFPRQPRGRTRLQMLFCALDAALRGKSS